MIVLLDTNIVANCLLARNVPELVDCETILKYCAKGRLTGFVNLPTLATTWYLMRKMNDGARREKLRKLCSFINLANTELAMVQQAIDNDAFPDFEDNLQDCCARQIHADYIVTTNIKDFFGHSQVPAIAPDDLLALLTLQSWRQLPPSAGEVREASSADYGSLLVTRRWRLPGQTRYSHCHELQR